MQDEWYREDLAYIHDVGFGDFALESAPGILEILDRNGISEGLGVDLGCGSGLWARELAKANYRVLGIDISESMIAIARERVPEAEFRVASLFEADIPPANAVTALGEVLNYLFDPDNDGRGLIRLFRRVHDALTPGGVFLFDVAEPGQVTPDTTTRGFTEGEDWVVLAETEEDRGTLTRRITTFRKVGEHYRRSDEVHRQRLYKAPDVASELRRVGFRVRTSRGYGRYRLPRAHAAFVARKPARDSGGTRKLLATTRPPCQNSAPGKGTSGFSLRWEGIVELRLLREGPEAKNTNRVVHGRVRLPEREDVQRSARGRGEQVDCAPDNGGTQE